MKMKKGAEAQWRKGSAGKRITLGSFACPKPYCSFLLLLQKKRTKEKEAGNDNFSLFWQNALGFTLPKKAEVHAISGLPARLKYKIRFIDHNSFYPKIL
jgi:hypothetical protein